MEWLNYMIINELKISLLNAMRVDFIIIIMLMDLQLFTNIVSVKYHSNSKNRLFYVIRIFLIKNICNKIRQSI
jgi:hypothetical protein